MNLAMRYFFLILVCSFSLFADEEIVVHLTSDDQLSTVAINPIRGHGFDKTYLAKLEKIFRFDLGHNGHMTVVKCTHRGSLLDQDRWSSEGVDFAAELSLSGSSLGAKVLNVKSGEIKQLRDIELTGVLGSDRRKIHEIADAIHYTFFGTPGIASSRVLYTLRTRKSSSSTNWKSEVWESDYDGANTSQITNDGHLCVTPTYLPGKANERCRNFLFVSYKIGQPKIYVSDTQKGGLKRLTFLRGNQLMPTISPRKDQIAFISDISGNPDLFIQDFSIEKGLLGKPRQIFTAPMSTQGTPTFSPDGKQIAFVSNKDGTARIYTMPIPGRGEGSLRLISKKNRNSTSPAWSSDGKKLAYCSTTSGVRQIWIYDFEKHEEIQLTSGSVHKENPTWASNSLHLMFNTEMNKSAELYLINLNQKEAVKITSGSGEKRFPTWEPLITR
ncbi:MAG: Tol-Pal system protein TolB [Chlamydiales bacterium]|nr:Tol-Pal system protein TolB [Chlamydiales bacterium]MCH9619453.1 Tol-Pal system protein TolB [Chlamydiales bacterium]MCH9622257.1 Tol-Pal system protein TolB [Chlamydiales bacterium]